MPKKTFLALIILFAVNLFFFSSFYFQGLYPFPGDLLLAEYNPWRQESFFGFNPGAVPHKAQSFDVLVQLYPWRKLAIEQFKKGEWPLWNPYNFSGTPLLANFQSAAFYPLNLFYFILNFDFVWALQVVLQPLLASLFFYFYLRKFKISLSGSLLGAIAFGYSSFMTVWLEYNTIGHVLLWLPLILLSIESIRETFSKKQVQNTTILQSIVVNRWSLILAFSLTCSLLAGHLQDFGMIWLFSLIYLFIRGWSRKAKIFSLFWLSPFFLGSLQFLPGLELVFNSARTPLDKEFLLQKVLLEPRQLIFAFVPDFFGNPATRNYFLDDTYIGKVLYIGLLPLILALFSFLKVRKEPLVKFFGLTILASLFLSMRNPLSSSLYSLPLFSSLSPTRTLFLFQFSFSVLAGFGYDLWRQINKKRLLLVLYALGFVFLFCWFSASGKLFLVGDNFLANLSVVRRNLFYSSFLFVISGAILFIGSLSRKVNLIYKLVPLLMIIFLNLDLFRFFSKITPFSPPEFIFPQTEIFNFLKDKKERFWGYGTAALSPNYNLLYQASSPEGYDPLYPRRYGEFISLSEEGMFKPAVRSNAQIAPGFGKEDFPQNPYRQKILQALSVKYLLDRQENQTDQTTFPPQGYPLVWQDNGWQIYEDKKSLPRAFLITDYQVETDKQKIADLIFAENFDLSKTVILEENPQLTIEPLNSETIAQGLVEITDYSPNKVEIKTDSPRSDLLFLSDVYYPGWQARIDGEKTPIYKANYTFRAIKTPSGEHQIEFAYQPFSFKIGLIISLFSLTSWLLWGGLIIIKNKLT